MPYSERIKVFERIRDYMREFYVYGFKSRDEFDHKSARSYDNERRRIESYLGDYMSFHMEPGGKNTFLSIDSRSTGQNPLYQVFKAKSFTDGDITLHFILLDILCEPRISLTLNEIMECMDRNYLSHFSTPMLFDASTVRNKLKEYADMGLISTKKDGKKVLYHRSPAHDLATAAEVVAFFSEAGLLGVVGSYLLDRIHMQNFAMDAGKEQALLADNHGAEHCFSFKHHYITYAMESEILFKLLEAIKTRKSVFIKNYSRVTKTSKSWEVIPLQIFVSAQTGRQYLMGYCIPFKCMESYRLDYITHVDPGTDAEQFDKLRKKLEGLKKHMWGVRCKNKLSHLEHVEFTVWIGRGEEHIYQRLVRERRCGQVERIDEHTARFTVDVFDTTEMIPWIRTFICRIIQLDFSNRTVENQFRADMDEMYKLYDLEGGDGDAVP